MLLALERAPSRRSLRKEAHPGSQRLVLQISDAPSCVRPYTIRHTEPAARPNATLQAVSSAEAPGLEPFGDAAVMRAGTLMGLRVAVRSILALSGSSGGSSVVVGR